MRAIILTLVLILGGFSAHAQIPVEFFAGHEKATVDIMFFKFFKNVEGQSTRWLFFNRNRASIDYRQTSTAYLPQFGFTEAVSYNHPALKGFAPVAVVQVLSRGVYPKAGLQYAHLNQHFTFFGWVVSELLKNPRLDLFILARYTPPLNDKWNLFLQGEVLNTFPTTETGAFSFTQRTRLGMKRQAWQFGAGLDLTQNGRKEYAKTDNIGAFLRYEF